MIRASRRPPGRSSPRRGILLLEMMIAIVLLSAFAIVATRLFFSSVKLSTQAAEARDATQRADLALWHLRTDAWTSTKIESTDAHTAVLTLSDNSTVTWTIEGKDLLRRAGEQNDRWLVTPSGEASFAIDGITLTFKTIDPKSRTGVDELSLPSQSKLIARLTTP